MGKIRLKPDNGRPVKFDGEEVVHVSNHAVDGPNCNRWSELTLYRTSADPCKYVYFKEYFTQWQGETGSTSVEVFDDLQSLADFLEIEAEENSLVDELTEQLCKKEPAFERIWTMEI